MKGKFNDGAQRVNTQNESYRDHAGDAFFVAVPLIVVG